MYPDGSGSDSEDEVEEIELEVRAYECETCGKLVILELIDDERRKAQNCPRCGRALSWLKADSAIDIYHTCLVPTCEAYLSTAAGSDKRGRCTANRSDKTGQCNRKLETLTLADAEMYVYGQDVKTIEEDDPRAVRQLKARMADAMAFVSSTGTHHASKGGSHTSGAREKHSKAAKNKAFVRRYYVNDLTERIAAVESLSNGKKTYASLLREAQSALNAVGNK